jgi:type I restriction enzyme R subunit
MATNFKQLQSYEPQLARLGLLAEKYFPDDPNTALLKVRQFGELLAQSVAAYSGKFTDPDESQFDLLYRLRDEGLLPKQADQLFHEIRKIGNQANHAISGDHAAALSALKMAWTLGVWFHRAYKDADYKSGPFTPPHAPKYESAEMQQELARLRAELAAYQATHEATQNQLNEAKETLAKASEDSQVWQELTALAEQEKAVTQARLLALQSQTADKPAAELAKIVKASNKAAEHIQLDEAATRVLIDQQLRDVGWEVDTVKLTYGKGARPEKGKNKAIAEWPTKTGRADYVLFIGLTPIAAVEAKKKNIDVSGNLQQSKRYSREFQPAGSMVMPDNAPWGEFQLPFVFSANGRPYLKQIETKSGVWFCDVRRVENLSRALDGWYSPEGLSELLKQDHQAAEQKLAKEPFQYDFKLRDYQTTAIQKVEAAIVEGRRTCLVAMATGTGKTKTCIALIYRLLKAQRFRRILFLVDRSALGEQAANAFKDTRMEGLQTFADIFGLKELEDKTPETATAVQIATIQGMVSRILFASEDASPPTVDQYDCIVIDECHRGYLLDRELSDTEMAFRSQEDYISKYRRVLEYFDAVKIGLTATPALHTTQIFGAPAYQYTYREAVIDGFLIDHEPPINIKTKLSTDGIHWQAGQSLSVYDVQRNQVELFTTPDEIKLEVEHFNKKVITEDFNRVVCAALAREIDPNLKEKTLIFCATDAHADLVVKLLKQALTDTYGGIDDDTVMKITGAAHKPLELIRRYKNESIPNIAVTVDLLTTGIDVPEITNLVFLRRVNSRILYEQMLGRATRLCDEIGKETFRIFDAVGLYDELQGMTTMQPVVVNPKTSFTQLAQELAIKDQPELTDLARQQFIAKLQRKKRSLSETQRETFEAIAGQSPDDFIRELRELPPEKISEWFINGARLAELLDAQYDGPTTKTFISDHPDVLVSITRGYGSGRKPADYLTAFAEYLKSSGNQIPALTTVLTRPRDLTRKELKQLAFALDQAGFSEASLESAWRETTNQEYAAKIVGYIRRAALGDALMPYTSRVDAALQKILGSRSGWTTPQRKWLMAIAAQTKVNLVVDRDAIDDPNQLFKQQAGGFDRLNKQFDGQLQTVLDQFNTAIWDDQSPRVA